MRRREPLPLKRDRNSSLAARRIVADELLVLVHYDREQFRRRETGKRKIQASSGCRRRDVLVLIFGSEGINPDRIVCDGADEKVRQRGTERVHLVFLRKLEKDLSIPQAGQLGRSGRIAVSQGQIKRPRVFVEMGHRKPGARRPIQNILIGRKRGPGGVELVDEHRGYQGEYDLKDAKVHAVAGPQDGVRSGIVEGSLCQPW